MLLIDTTETTETTAQLLIAWQEAQRVVDGLRLDAPGRVAAEDRLHDARNAYQDRIEELRRLEEEAQPDQRGDSHETLPL